MPDLEGRQRFDGGALMTDTQVESVAPETVEPAKKDWRAGRPQIQPEIMTERGAEIFRLRVAYKKDVALRFSDTLSLLVPLSAVFVELSCHLE